MAQQRELFMTCNAFRRQQAIDQLHAATAIYTAEAVVDDLLDRIEWPMGNRSLVDPSCGDGIFLGQALRRLLRLDPGASQGQLLRLLEGWEIHPGAAAQARERIRTILVEHGRSLTQATATAKKMIRNEDFLMSGPVSGKKYFAIVGNPPYLRFANVPEELRQDYLSVVPDYARADLLHPFLARCPDLLEDGGVVAGVTADRWLFNETAAKLRAALGSHLGIEHLQRLDPSTAFYQAKTRSRGTPPRIHPVAIVMRRSSAGMIALTGAAIYPDAANDDDDDAVGRTLGDVAEVRLAPMMDKVGAWLIGADEAVHFPKSNLIPAVDTDDLVRGRLGAPRRFVLSFGPDEEPPPEVLAHIDARWERLPKRYRRAARRWLTPERTHGLDLTRPSLMVPRIANTLRPIRVPPGVLPVNHNLSIVAARGLPLDHIEAALSSEEADRWIRARAPRLENGFLSITTSLLRRVPIAGRSA